MSGRTRRTALFAAFLILAVYTSGCGGGVLGYGFSGGGLPPHVKTVAVIPFENRTAESSIIQELNDQLIEAFGSRLGVRIAAESRANAVVRGVITRYDPDVPVAYSADPIRSSTARRRLVVVVDIEVVDQVTGAVLWSQQGMLREGEYSEREAEEGMRQAVERIVSDVVEGVQSQW